MSRPYTPDERNVRAAWITTGIGSEDALSAEFGRWLAQVRAEARREGQAEAWDDGATAGMRIGDSSAYDQNPYLQEGRHVDQ